MNLQQTFGNIDIYLFDQLLKERVAPDARILDAGCGSGRNIIYFLKNGFNVTGVDRSPKAIEELQGLAKELAPELSPENFCIANLENLAFEDALFDLVICNAVLHFSENETGFNQMLNELWRVLAPGGLFFTRIASTIGIEALIEPKGDRWYRLPDGTDRFLVDEQMLIEAAERLGGRLADPIKTTVVQSSRSMTTWVLWK